VAISVEYDPVCLVLAGEVEIGRDDIVVVVVAREVGVARVARVLGCCCGGWRSVS